MVFSKAPVPGQVKTRLVPPLSYEQAAVLHRELTERTLQTVCRNRLCDIQLWCAPSVEEPFFSALEQRYRVCLKLQQGRDLGERMHMAFEDAFATYRYAVLIGCDCPSLQRADLEMAMSHLSMESCCVLGPAEDGGYVLIGLNRALPGLFEDMPWGSDAVFTLTQGRLRSLDIGCVETRKHWDVDTPDDLERYRQLISPA